MSWKSFIWTTSKAQQFRDFFAAVGEERNEYTLEEIVEIIFLIPDKNTDEELRKANLWIKISIFPGSL